MSVYHVSNHRQLECLFNGLFMLTYITSKKKHHSPGSMVLCEGNPPMAGGFPSQRTSIDESVPSDDVIMEHKSHTLKIRMKKYAFLQSSEAFQHHRTGLWTHKDTLMLLYSTFTHLITRVLSSRKQNTYVSYSTDPCLWQRSWNGRLLREFSSVLLSIHSIRLIFSWFITT